MKETKPGPERVGKVLREIGSRLQTAGVDRPQLESELILSQALSIPAAQLYLEPERILENSIRAQIESWTQERLTRKPLAYIIGKAWFREIELEINPAVLIPRPETELLVEQALRIIQSETAVKTILDLATGSGAIILSLARELEKSNPDLQFFASDISGRALSLARKNAQRLRLGDRIQFRAGDWFQPFPGQKFHLIVCNPPYISEEELPGLMPEVSRYEPKLALNGGKQGLELIQKVLAEAPDHLDRPGRLVLEIGMGQAEKLPEIKTSLKLQKLVKDFAGIDRIAIFRL